MLPFPVPAINLNRKFTTDHVNVSLDLAAPGAPALMTALRDGKGVIPPGEISIGNITAKPSGSGTVPFGGGQTGGKVEFSGEASGSFGVGVYVDPASAIKALSPSTELVDGLSVGGPGAPRYLLVRASYDLSATANGSVALGGGVSATFGVTGSSSGLFAVLHRFADSELAVDVFKDTFTSWALPVQIDDANDLAPGTWLIAEVDGSISLKLGVQAGYDFSWIRSIANGALAGDIGLRVQLGASAALGFDASGRYAVVLARESNQQAIRLRLFKLAKKGWNFAFDARSGFKAELPPFFNQPHKAEDLVAAIFGLNANQIVGAIGETRAFVNSNVSLQDRLAGLLMNLGGKAIEEATGLTEDKIEEIYEAGRQRLLGFITRFDTMLSNGGQEVSSMLLSLAGPDFAQLQTVLKDISTGNTAQVQQLIGGLLSKAGFERSPIARLIEAGVGPALGVLNNNDQVKKLKALAGDTLALLDGGTLQQLLDFIRKKVQIDRVLEVVTQTDFNKLDNLLRDRLAAFLGKQTVLMEDLTKIQIAIQKVFANVDKFYSLALEAAKKQYDFSFNATYSRSTTRTALIDVTFDLTKAGNVERMRKAVRGDFDDLLLQSLDGVTLGAAELTHNIKRNVSSELAMPFGNISSSAETLSSAKLTIVEDEGRVLVYALDASDEVSERSTLFARSGRDSTLTLAATLPARVSSGISVWKESSFSYTYRMERAVAKMRASQLLNEIGPMVEKYVPAPFGDPGARSFDEFVADLDKALDNKDPNSGTHDIGDTLVTLTLTAPPSYLKAWSKAPTNRKDALYMDLSRALQSRLKELVTFYYFSDPSRYKDLDAAAAPIVFSCIPPSTSIRLDRDDKVERFNTNDDFYWDQSDIKQIRAMASAPQTAVKLATRLKTIASTLRGIPEVAGFASFYGPDRVDDIVATALRKRSVSSRVPEFLSTLLDLEQRLVENAIGAGVEIARFRETAATKPSAALENLAEFGEDLAKTFNQLLGGNPFLSGASRPLGTLLFMEAATTFDPFGVTGSLAAMLDITVIQSGKLTIDDMLAGKITDPIVLYQQPFVQS